MSIITDMSVPAGLFFLQKAFEKKTPNIKVNESNETITQSLYDRLLNLAGNKSERKTKRRVVKNSIRRKTKKNN
jgi:hypothetical protein